MSMRLRLICNQLVCSQVQIASRGSFTFPSEMQCLQTLLSALPTTQNP